MAKTMPAVVQVEMKKGAVELRELPVPEIGEDEVLLRDPGPDLIREKGDVIGDGFLIGEPDPHDLDDPIVLADPELSRYQLVGLNLLDR